MMRVCEANLSWWFVKKRGRLRAKNFILPEMFACVVQQLLSYLLLWLEKNTPAQSYGLLRACNFRFVLWSVHSTCQLTSVDEYIMFPKLLSLAWSHAPDPTPTQLILSPAGVHEVNEGRNGVRLPAG